MYPKTRAKGGSNDGSDAGGVAPISPALAYDAVATAGDSAYSPSHSATSHHTSVTGTAGGRGSSQASPTHPYGQQHSMPSPQQQPQQQQAPLPPPPPHMSGGPYYDAGFDRAGPSPGPMQQQQQQPPYYGANTPSPFGPKQRRNAASPYDQPPPPPPPPPVSMHGGGYHGDWGMPGGSTGPMMSGGTTPLGSPGGMVGGPGGGPVQSAFSLHSRTNSSNVMTPIMAAGGGMGSGGPEYRPPPMYGDVTGGAMSGLNASTGSTGFANMSRGGGGPNPASMNTSMTLAPSPSRRPVHMGPAAAQAPPPPPPPLPPPPPPHMQMTGPSGASVVQVGGGHAMPGRYYESSPQMYPSAGPSVSGVAPGVSSLKITVGGSGVKGMPTSAPLSPLINSPPIGSHPQSTQAASSPSQQPQQSQQQQQAQQQQYQPERSADRGGRSALRLGVEGGKGAAQAEGVSMPSLASPDTNTEADATEEAGNGGGGSSHTAGIDVARTAVAQAEARYQYLYEEFRKASRARSKLTEENERLKREHAVLQEELDYYRRKTASAAEEREAILCDYRDDVRHALRVVQALASDAAAAGATAPRPVTGYPASGPTPAVSPQQVLESVLTRLSAASTPGASSSTVHPPALPASTVNTAAHSAPSSPSLSAAGSVHGTALPPLADRLGLRCGQWMARPAGAPPPTPPLDDDAGDRAHSVGSRVPGVLLRDEVRDVHRGAHAAIGAYMASLDYGFAPAAGQRSLSSSIAQGSPHQQQQQPASPNLFSSEYRGLHLFVDVPRFHGHTHSVTSDLSNPGGAATAGGDGTGGHNTPILGVNTQLPPQHHQLQQPPQQQYPPSPYSSPHSRARSTATPL